MILNKNVTQWRYSYHHHSIFSAWFGLRLGVTNSIAWAKKHFTCTHRFGCFESFLRKTAKTVAILLFLKGATSILLGVDVQQESIKLIKDNVE